ncbi:MAG: RnfABCDGE type electron transport complex subunit B [Arenicellales bacterium]
MNSSDTEFIDDVLINQIDQLLPQTQCTQCDYPRCRDYAAAIAEGEADINQCPPGTSITIEALAALTGRPVKPLNPQHGVEEDKVIAYIREAACIGCKLCIKACPVDCIIGAGKLMHTVITDECTGCKLCVPVCPTDCIDLLPAPSADGTPSRWPAFTQDQVNKARRRTEIKLVRTAAIESERKAHKLEKRQAHLKQEIQAVLARKRKKQSDESRSD